SWRAVRVAVAGCSLAGRGAATGTVGRPERGRAPGPSLLDFAGRKALGTAAELLVPHMPIGRRKGAGHLQARRLDRCPEVRGRRLGGTEPSGDRVVPDELRQGAVHAVQYGPICLRESVEGEAIDAVDLDQPRPPIVIEIVVERDRHPVLYLGRLTLK